MKPLDPRALEILRKYNLLAPEQTSAEDFSYAKEHGLMFDIEYRGHDEIVDWAISEVSKCSKESIADAFLWGLENQRPDLRSAFSAYAIAVNFPRHTYVDTKGTGHCDICATLDNAKLDLSFFNNCRWTGSVINRKPAVLAFYLQQHNRLEFDERPARGVELFREVLELISNSPPDEKPTTLAKKIRQLKELKFSAEQAKFFLDALGYAGILATPEHPGFIYRYTGHLNPRKSRSSDWGYPVDFWTGKDGIHRAAVAYWFGQYPSLTGV